MPKASDDLLSALWHAIDRAAALECELHVASQELRAWREVAEAAVRALDTELARRCRDEDANGSRIAERENQC